VAQPPVDRAREAAAEQVEKARLTFRRLSGLDRSGPPPPATLPGAPWHVWTLPNGIGLVRLVLIPVFLILGLQSDTGTDPVPAVLFALIAWADYADGIAARVTGQYSRFGALLDPVVDRLLVISGGAVCWYHELLPRWALAVLVGRELFTKYEEYDKEVFRLPKKLDEKVAKIHLDALGGELTKLTKEQAEYINVDVEGPYKPEHYRY